MSPVKCPQCGQKTGLPIQYGLVGYEMGEAAERGEVVLGGCCVEDDQPTRACTACGYQWRPRPRSRPLSIDWSGFDSRQEEGPTSVKQWKCLCCGNWADEGYACPHGISEEMYDEVGRSELERREVDP